MQDYLDYQAQMQRDAASQTAFQLSNRTADTLNHAAWVALAKQNDLKLVTPQVNVKPQYGGSAFGGFGA